MTPADYLPDLAAELDRLVPLEAPVAENWADVVRRVKGVTPGPRRRLGVHLSFIRTSRLRIMIAAVVGALLLAGIATAGYLGIRALVGGGSAPAANGPVTLARMVGDVTEISTVRPDGRLQTVWRCPTKRFCGFPTGLDWSPDGNRLAFTLDSIALSPPLARGLHVVDVRSGRDHQLASGACTAQGGVDWAPDGRQLALVCNNSLTIIGAGGGTLRRIVSIDDRSGGIESPSWAPDGKRLVFVVSRGGRFTPGPVLRRSVYVVNADGSGRRLLVERGASPAWSPDGTKIAYSGPTYGGSSCGRLHLITPEGVDVTPGGRSSACGGTGRGIGPHGSRAMWSPDGARIALGTNTGTYVMNADGTGLRRISTTPPAGLAWQSARSPAPGAVQDVSGCPGC